MYCKNCGAEINGGNFCSFCGQAVTEATPSLSLINKAVSVASLDDQYSLVLISCGSCSRITTGDLLEDVFGYTDAESTNLVNMAPVVVGERMSADEAGTVAQLLTEYGVQVSIVNQDDQYVDLTSKANTSVFDSAGNLLSGIASVIGALTVSNRIRTYRRFKKPSLLERLFHIGYEPKPPVYRRNFRPRLDPHPVEPRHTIRKAPSIPRVGRRSGFSGPENHGNGRTGFGDSRNHGHQGPGSSGPNRDGGHRR